MSRTCLAGWMVVVACIICGGMVLAQTEPATQPQATQSQPALQLAAVWFPLGTSRYIDCEGKQITRQKFQYVEPFFEGLAAVTRKGGGLGFIDSRGKMVIAPRFKQVQIRPDFAASGFSEGFAAVYTEERKWGFIDATGKELAGGFDNARSFSEGLSAVKVGDKWGFIDTNGKLHIEPQFEGAAYFSEGLARVHSGGKAGFIDHTGKFVIAPSFDAAWLFTQGVAPAQNDGKYGYINHAGEWVIAPQFESARSFGENLAAVKSGNRWGFIDKSGKFVIQPEFANVDSSGFRSGIAVVERSRPEDKPSDGEDEWQEFRRDFEARHYYIDRRGQRLFGKDFSSASPFQNGLAQVVYVDDSSGMATYGYINLQGNWVWQSKPEKWNPDAFVAQLKRGVSEPVASMPATQPADKGSD